MELNNIFPDLNDKDNYIFIGKFHKHKYYKDINVFTDFDVNDIESNTKWNCKLSSNFHSKDDIKNDRLLKYDIFDELSKDILSYVQKEIKKHNIPNIRIIKKIFYIDGEDLWYNIYKKGFYQERHNHAGLKNILSGIYYYRSPSTIRFYKYPHEVIANFQPVEGDIILFPSTINHSVPKYNGDDIRISFAFNLGIRGLR